MAVRSDRCFLCGAQIVGAREYGLQVVIDEFSTTREQACWPCYSKVSLSGEVRVRREGAELVVRVIPLSRVEGVA